MNKDTPPHIHMHKTNTWHLATNILKMYKTHGICVSTLQCKNANNEDIPEVASILKLLCFFENAFQLESH